MKKLTLMLVLVLQACSLTPDIASKGALFELHANLPQSDAIVYLFNFSGDQAVNNRCLLVRVDGETQEGCLGFPGFVRVHIRPGEHKLSFVHNAWIKLPLNMSINSSFESGKAYYFEFRRLNGNAERKAAVQWSWNMLTEADYGWFAVEEQEALSKLKNLREWD